DNPLRRWLLPATSELARLDLHAGLAVADLGAGVGFHAEALLQLLGPGGSLLLVDPDRENLELVPNHYRENPRVRILIGSAAHLPTVPTASQDRVLLSLTLCCLVDKEGVLGESWRILRPGGLVLATFPRARRRPNRRRPLRMTRDRWRALEKILPWEVLSVRSSFWIHRHLLRKPTTG
ncbi:MAG: class I SAM-dependent methyltransferase, partial [Thermoplasmata archaeon]|nr:class I SAM-dependent methyltransferase [Thermoplasmata archaeon]